MVKQRNWNNAAAGPGTLQRLPRAAEAAAVLPRGDRDESLSKTPASTLFWLMKFRTVIGTCALLCVVLPVGADEEWDAREARGVRRTYPAFEHLSDFAQVKDAFERGLSGDATVAPALVALVKHANEDVASIAAQMLGRFPSEMASTALKDSYATDQRDVVRAGALAGLARMKDPATAPLAIAALSSDDEGIRGMGVGALEFLGDRRYAPAILQYLDQHRAEASVDMLENLGRMGDPPGSTAVRDRLLAEANNKRNRLNTRHSAALGLESMGLAQLVKPILNYSDAVNSNSTLIVVKGAMEDLAVERNLTVKGQAEVDVLLRDIKFSDPRRKQDEWGRALRAKFISPGVFHVVSDGPDMAPETQDDLSTAEPWTVYSNRAFPDLFIRP